MIKNVLHNQSLFDFCLQHSGMIENVFDFAMKNGLSVTAALAVGNTLKVPKTNPDTDILQYYQANRVLPATGLTPLDLQELENTCQGIGCMIIGKTFKVWHEQ